MLTLLKTGLMLVALRKESVDRNQQLINTSKDIIKSLSARRAWIEIIIESDNLIFGLSLSARRAWIEIRPLIHHQLMYRVALRKESVDRNKGTFINSNRNFTRRSPQGERG